MAFSEKLLKISAMLTAGHGDVFAVESESHLLRFLERVDE
jgi:hypothetical protein